jgi:hypothetical protein
MATAGGKKKLPSKVSVSRSDFYIPPLPVAVVPVRKSFGEDVMGWIAACVLVALLLPLMAMVYLDNLTVSKRAEKNLEKTEKLERQVQELKREIERKKDE